MSSATVSAALACVLLSGCGAACYPDRVPAPSALLHLDAVTVGPPDDLVLTHAGYMLLATPDTAHPFFLRAPCRVPYPPVAKTRLAWIKFVADAMQECAANLPGPTS